MHKAKPSICIIMATYNGERFLAEQIESILNQSYQDFELIVCDDKSTDATVDIVHSYMKVDNRIILHQNKENLGVVKNFENGLMKCDCDYIAFSDQDDVWHKNKLDISMQKLLEMSTRHPDTPILIHSDLEMINESGNSLYPSYFNFRRYVLSSEKDLKTIISQNGVMGNTVLMNHHLKKLILPFPDYLIVHDYWIALINEIYGKRITLYEPLVQYRIHTKNLSNSSKIIGNDYRSMMKKTLTFDFNLPYKGVGREKVLRVLLSDYKLSLDDKKVIEKFLIYLDFNRNRLHIFYVLIKYNLIKTGFFYRVKFFLKLMLTRNIPSV